MQHFLWGKVVLVLVAVVAILQVVHLILLSRLESRHHHRHEEQTDPVSSSGNEVEAAFAILARNLHQGRVLDASGEYQVVPNLAPGTRLPQGRVQGSLPDVTLVTQCSFNHVHRVLPLVQRWQGPVSVAVFAEEHDLPEALWSILSLRLCHSEVRENVSFQLVSPLPAGGHPPLTAPPDSSPPCHSQRSLLSDSGNYAGIHQYPNNLLRNVARRGAGTEFVLVVDVDMLPSANLRQDFYHFAVKSRLFSESHREDKTVYVVPAFEARETVPMPRHKAELLRLADKGDLRPFYIQLCWKCQVHTDYEAWQKEPPTTGLAPLFEVLWKDPWEPFYIARNSVPFYDERFKQYGFNRISQVCELHVAGYKFSVLNNGFLVHRGLKTASSFHESKDLDQERNRMLFRQFKVELRDKYPESSRRCY